MQLLRDLRSPSAHSCPVVTQTLHRTNKRVLFCIPKVVSSHLCNAPDVGVISNAWDDQHRDRE
jgi:hypothetical protein